MGRSIDDVIAAMPKQQQKAVQARYDTLYAEELTLRNLRKAQELTQKDMAVRLHKRQDEISKLENRSDLLLSTLRGYVEKMGGRLDLVVSFPDQKPVSLIGYTTDDDR